MASLMLILTGLSIGLFWSFYPYKTFEANTQPFPIVSHEVRAGDAVVFYSDTCRYVTGNVDVHIALVDGVLISFPDRTFYQEIIECKAYNNASIVIPTTVPVGTYHLEITSTMQVNPIRKISTKFITEKFNVIK